MICVSLFQRRVNDPVEERDEEDDEERVDKGDLVGLDDHGAGDAVHPEIWFIFNKKYLGKLHIFLLSYLFAWNVHLEPN